MDPEFGEAVMVQSGAQTRNSEEGPSSSRMQEKAAGNHGMQGALGDGGGAGGVQDKLASGIHPFCSYSIG